MLTNLLGTALCKGGASKGLMMEPKHLAFNHQEMNRTWCFYIPHRTGRT